MKIFFKIVFIAIFFGFSQNVFAGEILAFAADYWCPYNCHPKEKNPGYVIKILEAIYKPENVDYTEINWARAIYETRNGVYNAIIAAGPNEAPGFIYPKHSVGVQTVCYYTKEDSTLKINNLADVAKLQLGIMKDYTYYNSLDAYIADPKNKRNIHENFGDNAFDIMMKGLFSGNYDVVPETDNVMKNRARAQHFTEKIKSQFCHTPGNLYIAFSPKINNSQKYADQFDEGILELIKSGKMNKIIAAYGVKPWYK